MTGRLIEGAEKINQVLWADAELESVEATYDTLKIKLQESNGQMTIVSCLGYIGYENIGFWDELVIATATMHKSHELIDRSLRSIQNRLGKSIPDSGCNQRNSKIWNLLQIQFIDGSELNVVTAGISITAIS